MARRVAFAGFLHETNTFAPVPATMDDFIQGGGYIPMSRGPQLLDNAVDVNLGVAGGLKYAREKRWEPLPVLWAGAIPSAPVAETAYEAIVEEIVSGIAALGPIDGLFLDLHGAMVASHIDDGEGELLARLRAVIGNDVPIACPLDLHGNITQRMFNCSDVMVGFRTYPHIDMAETGYRAAAALDMLMDAPRPWSKAIRRGDFLIPIAWQCTDVQPARRLYREVAELEDGQGVASTSLFTGFPAADFPECGPAVIAYGRDANQVAAAADTMIASLRSAEREFSGKAYSPQQGVRLAIELSRTASRPVIIADTQDNPGAGGTSDTTGMLAALVSEGAENAAIGCIVDPAAASAAHAAGEGKTIFLALGGRSGIPGDSPFEADFVVEKLSDGHAHATGPYYGGAHMQMGPSACLRLNGTRIVVTSETAQMADRALYRMVGILPEEQAILVNKSSVHFRADFEPIAETILVCVAPGAMPLSPASLNWHRLPDNMKLEPLGITFKAAIKEREMPFANHQRGTTDADKNGELSLP